MDQLGSKGRGEWILEQEKKTGTQEVWKKEWSLSWWWKKEGGGGDRMEEWKVKGKNITWKRSWHLKRRGLLIMNKEWNEIWKGKGEIEKKEQETDALSSSLLGRLKILYRFPLLKPSVDTTANSPTWKTPMMPVRLCLNPNRERKHKRKRKKQHTPPSPPSFLPPSPSSVLYAQGSRGIWAWPLGRESEREKQGEREREIKRYYFELYSSWWSPQDISDPIEWPACPVSQSFLHSVVFIWTLMTWAETAH